VRAADRTRSACTSLQRGIALLSTLWIDEPPRGARDWHDGGDPGRTRFFRSLLAQAEARHMAEERSSSP
jgi:hypothetical protein